MARAALKAQGRAKAAVVYLGLELGLDKWVLCFSNGAKERIITLKDGNANVASVLAEAERAREKLGATPNARVVSCYEAGRHGFDVHRQLRACGIENVVVDSSSIEVARRERVAKTDKLDAKKLARLLIRHESGEPKVLHAVRVPSIDQEDERRPQRELQRLKKERTGLSNRIKSTLFLCGVRLRKINRRLPDFLAQATQSDGRALPANLVLIVRLDFERWTLATRQMSELRAARRRRLVAEQKREVAGAREGRDRIAGQVLHLMRLFGIGEECAWLLVTEFFGWRDFQNRRQVAASAGIAPTPHASSTIQREQGISKAGNARVRWMMNQIAWRWLRHQPDSAITRWFLARFGGGTSRPRRIGITAVTRKLLVALWRYDKSGVVPDGARMKDDTYRPR